jgi:hypothetical protein
MYTNGRAAVFSFSQQVSVSSWIGVISPCWRIYAYAERAFKRFPRSICRYERYSSLCDSNVTVDGYLRLLSAQTSPRSISNARLLFCAPADRLADPKPVLKKRLASEKKEFRNFSGCYKVRYECLLLPCLETELLSRSPLPTSDSCYM